MDGDLGELIQSLQAADSLYGYKWLLSKECGLAFLTAAKRKFFFLESAII